MHPVRLRRCNICTVWKCHSSLITCIRRMASLLVYREIFFYVHSILWIQGRWRKTSQPSIIQCCHHFALLWWSWEKQSRGCHPPGHWKSHGTCHILTIDSVTCNTLNLCISACLCSAGGRFCGQRWLWRCWPAANRKRWHLHAHLLQ